MSPNGFPTHNYPAFTGGETGDPTRSVGDIERGFPPLSIVLKESIMFITYVTTKEDVPHDWPRITGSDQEDVRGAAWDATIQLCREDDSIRIIRTPAGLLAVSQRECHRRSCRYCESRNAGRRRRRIYAEMQKMALPLWRVDLTLPGERRDFTASYITRSLDTWSTGIQALRANQGIGDRFTRGITVIEITVAKAGFHVHCHSIWANGRYIELPELRTACASAGLGTDVHVSYLSDGMGAVKQASYLAGYLTKKEGYAIPECCREAYDKALKGRRLLQTWH